ncbi:MAG: SDR family oxidoreductase [Oscillospiraceae bacterium]|nr:SDR family oxidoreductase [Oscillospiraceae bacterium]
MTDIELIQDFSLNYFRLDGKVAIVTGANKGLGMGYAVALAKAGADIYLPYRSGDIEEVKALIEAEGRRVEFIQGDLTDMEHIHAIVEGCMAAYGKIDILVTNAGTNCFEDFVDFPDDGYMRVINTNLNSVYFLGHEVSKIMIKQGHGKIINIGSALSYTADERCPSYIAAKHGIIGLTRSFANELGKYNIQTNVVCPGFIETGCTAGVVSDDDFTARITRRITAGRWGNLADIMGTIVFLASRASDYVNGADIKVDGGFSTKLV